MPLFNLRRAYDAAKKAEEEALRDEGRQERQKVWEDWKDYHDRNGRRYDNPPRLDDPTDTPALQQ